jgi:hypothetical protein
MMPNKKHGLAGRASNAAKYPPGTELARINLKVPAAMKESWLIHASEKGMNVSAWIAALCEKAVTKDTVVRALKRQSNADKYPVGTPMATLNMAFPKQTKVAWQKYAATKRRSLSELIVLLCQQENKD